MGDDVGIRVGVGSGVVVGLRLDGSRAFVGVAGIWVGGSDNC